MRTGLGDEVEGLTPSTAKSNWKSLFYFSSRQHWPLLFVALVLSTAAGIAGPALAILFGKIFDAFSAFGSATISSDVLKHKVSTNATYLCILGGTVWCLKGGYFALWMVFGELQAQNARDLLFQSLLEKDLEWFEMRTSGIGALLPRLQAQIRELQMGTSQPLGFCVQYVVQMFASLGLAFYTSWKLTLVILAGLPLSAVIMSFISSMMQPSIISQEIQLSLASKLVSSALSAIDTVKCCNGQAFEHAQYKPVVKEAARHYMRQAMSNALQIGFVRLVTTAMFVQGFWYGGHLVITRSTSAGDVITTFWACLMATKAIEDILPHMMVLEKGRAAGAAMKAILDQMSRETKLNSGSGKKTPKFCEGDIEVREVTFAYPARHDKPVLDKSTFFFPAGETTFVIGKSGSGKSTIGNLLLRFYEPTSGHIFVDGTAIGELDLNWLRNNITLVQQQSILFNETIFRNISLGKREYLRVTQAEVDEGIKLAALEPTIKDMPKGMETQVGSGGGALSGGQKQRIAIARARLRDTPILILDESTSALDYISRKSVMDAIRDWRRGKTTVIITHALSHIEKDDYVYVLENGRVVGDGYRDNLASLDNGAVDLLGRPMAGDVGKPGLGLAANQSSTQHNDRYSNMALDVKQSIPRRDSIEMSLNPYPRSILGLPDPSTSLSGTQAASVPPKRSSAGKLLVALKGQSRVQDPARTSLYLAASKDVELRGFNTVTPKSLSVHHALSRGGRPMSIHQALTMQNLYDGPVLPAVQRASIRTATTRSDLAVAASGSDQRSINQEPPQGEVQTRVPQGVASVSFILRTVWPNLSFPKRVQLILGFASALIHAAGPPSFSYVLSQLLGTFFVKDHQAQKALVYSMAILGLAVVDAVSDGSMHYLLEGCGQAWVDTLRLQAFERILDQPKEWFDKAGNDVSSLTSSLDRNAEEMRNLVGRFAPFIVVVVAMMTIATSWSLAVCWRLTLVGIAAAPLLYLVTKGFEMVSNKWENMTNTAGNATGSIFVETFSDVRTVRALTLESYFHKKYSEATAATLVIGIKRAVFCGIFFGASDSAINFVTALVFWYGAEVAQRGDVSVKAILTVFTMLLFSTANANAVIAYIPQISSSADSATRLLRLASLPLHQSHEYTGTLKLSPSDPTTLSAPITFTNLTFHYPSRGPTATALCRLHLSIPAGTSTALVGSSGSGKSTIAALLLCLYPSPTTETSSAPTLTLSNHPIQTLHTPTLRDLISLVPQTPTLFPTTVRANITYGLPLLSPLTTTANIHTAARRAGIHDFIMTLPRGYETQVGDGGLGLSGGQAQRVVIARALVRRPRVLVLDEATSALDAESARVVRQSVLGLMDEGRREAGNRSGKRAGDGSGSNSSSPMTVLIITHAREMMACAENVVVLDRGRVVEQGGYQELLRREGGALWNMLRDS